MVSRDTTLYDAATEERRRLWGEVLGSYAGRFILFEIIGKGDVYDLAEQMSFDPAIVQRQLGRRDMALEVLKEALGACPDVYVLMQREAKEFQERFTETLELDDED